MAWNPQIVSQGELHALREAAERAWGDDTRHEAYKGHPNQSAGQCYVTSRWLRDKLGGHVGRTAGHYVWVAPDKSHVIDLTGDQFGGDQPAPILYKKASHPLFENLEILPEHQEDSRARRFMTRANQEYDNLGSKESKISLDYAGDAFPAEEPQAVEDMNQRYFHDEPGYEPGDDEFKFVYGNGNLEVSPAHDHGELADHAGIEMGASGPMAMGYITVKLGNSIWEISASNIGAHALTRIMKDYSKHVGWKWGGATDGEGEPIGQGSEFGPKGGSVSMPYRYVSGELLIGASGAHPSDLVRQHLSSANGDGSWNLSQSISGWLRVSDDQAKLVKISLGGRLTLSYSRLKLAEFLSAIQAYAKDEGLQLLSANDNVLKTIEDLDQDNLYSPDMNQKDRQFFPPEPGDARGPGGMYKCPQCSQLFPTWDMYMQHRQHEEPDGDPEGGFPEIDMDATQPTHFTERKPELQPVQLARVKEAKRVYGSNVPKGQHLVAYSYGCAVGALSYDQKITGFRALTSSARRSLINKFFRLAEASPTESLEAELPFIYDIKDDHIHVGEPGQRTSQIPGQFTPGGIVEGTYEPGGKVFIRSMTNMPYTVRHMVELWYHTHPELEVKAVHLRDDEGKDTKLAAAPKIQEVGSVGEEDMGVTGAESRRPFRYDAEGNTVYLGPPGSFHHTLQIPQTGQPAYRDGYVMLDHPSVDSYGTVPDHVLSAVAQHMGPEFTVAEQFDPWEFEGAMQPQAVGTYIKALAYADPTVDAATKALQQQGGKVYAVGGAVRDAILGKQPHDLDVMVQGIPPDQVKKTLEALPGSVDLTGKDFGVFRYRHGGHEVEIALPRRERSTGEGHKDFDVQTDHTMKPEDDLYRRDFTANAMAVDLGTGELLDPYGGAEDLANGQLSAVHEHALAEDPLRIIRGLVAHSKHGLDPDEATKAQMAGNADSLDHLPPERIQAELDKLMSSEDPAKAVELAHKTGVLKHIFPEVDEAFGYDQNNPHHELELGEHLLSVLRRTAELTDDPDLRLAALLHDVGKPASAWVDPQTGKNHFYKNPSTGEGADHEDVGAEMARKRMNELRYPKDRIARVHDLVQHHMWSIFTSPKGARKFLNKTEPHSDDLFVLREADQNGKFAPGDPERKLPDLDEQRAMINEVRQGAQPTQRSQLAVDGNDLIKAGIQPGPDLGRILNELTDRVIEDPSLNNRDTLLQLATTI